MKKIFLAAIVASALFSCSSAQENHATAADTEESVFLLLYINIEFTYTFSLALGAGHFRCGGGGGWGGAQK